MTGNRWELGRSFALGPRDVRRAGHGAMQLAGNWVFEPSRRARNGLMSVPFDRTRSHKDWRSEQ
jgi:hypothetical protein